MSSDFEVVLPKLGESIMNATVIQWFKKEGDPIKKDEPLLEVATDKVNSEIPSPVAGILKKIQAHPDTELDVGEPLCQISTDETAAAPQKTAPAEKAPATEDNKDYYSPALLRIARENNIPMDELQKIPGTGGGGRITKQDLEAYIANKPCPLEPQEGVEAVKMSPLRRAIAENLVRSYREIPHASLFGEADVTDLLALIKKEKAAYLEKHGVKLSITAFIARALSKTLQEFTLLNSTIQGDTIHKKSFINLGIAVSVEDGVMVPVIKGCEKMGLEDISKAVATFAKKAREKTLSLDDVQEGTITMTNFGMGGIQIGIPIIRHPEAAIIGIGAIVKKPIVLTDDSISVRQMMSVSLTFDHRVIDGMYGCNFLNTLRSHIENDLEVES